MRFLIGLTAAVFLTASGAGQPPKEPPKLVLPPNLTPRPPNPLLGKQAPDTAGTDLAGKAVKLSDYKGKVVLVSFWYDACLACRNDYPCERELAARLKGQPFAILGVNSDLNQKDAQAAVVREKMTWQSIRDPFNKDGTVGPVALAWGVTGYPTVFLVDTEGVVRRQVVFGTPTAELTDANLKAAATKAIEDLKAIQKANPNVRLQPEQLTVAWQMEQIKKANKNGDEELKKQREAEYAAIEKLVKATKDAAKPKK
jgi:peroxiredoxin